MNTCANIAIGGRVGSGDADVPKVLCFGEMLWDLLPTGAQPGGAPLNVAYHLRRFGVSPYLLSAVGCDALGDALLARLADWVLPQAGVTTHAALPTGQVRVKLSAQGDAHYEIVAGVAWDRIAADPACAVDARALVFGSLAARSVFNRFTLARLLAALPKDAERVFDVNLRPPYDDPQRVLLLARKASLIKLNADEARQLAAACGDIGLEYQARHIAALTGAPTVCITAGARGAGLLQQGRWYWQPARPIQVRDSVGAGDAFLAGLVGTRLRGLGPVASLKIACRLGEWVASQAGAMPQPGRIHALQEVVPCNSSI